MRFFKYALIASALFLFQLQASAQFQMPKLSAVEIQPGKVTSQTGMIRHPWTGKTVFFIGDSISDCVLSQVMGDNATIYQTQNHYYQFLAQWLGITPVVTAISGMEWNSVEMQLGMYKDKMGDKIPDAICIFLGTNDYFAGLPIGDWYKEEITTVHVGSSFGTGDFERVHRVFDYNANTYKGRINNAMKLLKEAFPTTPIVVFTPIHRAYFNAGENNIQPDEMYQNRIGLYLDEYIEATKQVGNVWSVNVIDLNSISNMIPVLDAQTGYFTDFDTDRLHPNEQGHKYLAQIIMYQTLMIPCRLTE